MAAITICSDFGAQEEKVSHCFHCFPIYFPCSDGTRCHDVCFLNVEFKPAFSLSSFTFIKRLFSSSLLSAIRVVSSTCLRFLIYIYHVKRCFMFISKLFMFSDLTFRPLIHFEFIFAYGVRECSIFILLHIAVQFPQSNLFLHFTFLPPLL